ncbi:MAG: hypothetical protein R3343_02770 [Nitriliruptorales bacterium]|nr:hypothetical protein [Nitriliruptorales bacterium]
MSKTNGHRHLRQRLPPHTVKLVPEPGPPWYEHEAFLVLGSLTALVVALFGNVLAMALEATLDPVVSRPLLYVGALAIGVLCLRGAGNTLRSAGSVTASNSRLLLAAMAAFAVMFASALALFSLLALLDHLIG